MTFLIKCWNPKCDQPEKKFKCEKKGWVSVEKNAAGAELFVVTCKCGTKNAIYMKKAPQAGGGAISGPKVDISGTPVFYQ